MPRYFSVIDVKSFRKIVSRAFGSEDEDTELYDDPFVTLQIRKDIKCEFDCENISYDNGSFGPEGLMGFNTLENDLTYYGICAGGDWELPVFFIIYWDGKKLRGYVPKSGNPWNTDTKMAYGNDEELDDKNMRRRYPRLNLRKPVRPPDWNVDLIKKDIMKRIVKRRPI
jgi:hypothetical protein